LGALHDLYDQYRERVAFFVIYIKEAHPEDGWVVTPNVDEGITVRDPRSVSERVEVAESCALRASIRMPVVVDGLENRVARAYGGWPDRLYLIGCDGRVAFQGEEGPIGFRPEQLAAAIERELSSESTVRR
jgi:hypothetical protein